ncbi:MAG: ShlB/FhaC/HecB family hemolysin secretion/activation protein [Phreatobacter sp.]
MQRSRRTIAGVCLAGMAISAGPAWAQTASQITPQTFRPPVVGGQGSLVIPEGPGLEAPPGAERLNVRLRDVVVEGGLPAMAAATRAITAPLADRTVNAAEIFAVARALEVAYARAGYGLVRVILPAQRIVNGARLRLVVVDGFIERIDVQGVPEAVRGRIAALLGALVGERGITLALIERKLLLASDTPGTILRSTLTAGGTPGASVLVVEAKHRIVTGQLTIDNTLSSALGRVNSGIGVELNSAAGAGEQLYLRASGYPNGGDHGVFANEPLNRSLAAGLVMPLGLDGLTFNLEATNTRATPRAAANGLGSTSSFDRLSARLRYPWIRSRDFTLGSELSFDAQEERVSVITPLSAPISLDRLRIVRVSGDLLWLSPWGGQVTGRVTGSFGINGLGARSAQDATPLLPLSRQGIDASFQKLELSLGYNQQLIEHLAVDLRARAQTSFGQPLARSEQMGLASLTGLSSFDSGTFQGDAGYVVRGEIQSPWQMAIPSGFVVIAPYLFGAYGAVRIERPTVLEAANIHGASYGLGIRMGGAPAGGQSPIGLSQVSFSLEWGRQHRSDNKPTTDRVTFSGAVQF